jgi:elongator complex protein 1
MALQADMDQFEVELKTAVEEIWHKPIEKDDAGAEDWTGIKEKERQLNPTDRVEKPGLNDTHWQLKLYSLAQH